MSKILIVGGVAGGASAAARLRRMDESAEIIIFERGPYVSFANCGLPYHIGGVIKERESLLVSTPESLRAEFNIDVRTGQEVIAIDRSNKEITVRVLDTDEIYQEGYDKLILSPGAKPLIPPVPGVDLPGVFWLRTIPDMDAIKAHVDSGQARAAVVVGGGFIGLETAENLMHRGLDVTIVEMLDQVITPLDFEMAALVHSHLRLKNVRLALGEGLKSISQENGQLAVTLASGTVAHADMVVLSVGVQPESELAKSAGLEVGPRGHVVVNQSLQTSDENIYAIGDVIQVSNAITGQPTAIPLAGPANRQGRLAADHIVGRNVAYQGTQGTAIVKVFDLTVAITGLNAKQLQQQDIAFRSTITHSHDHASYYPGASQMAIKLLYNPDDGRLLGAQVVGAQGVDRTIDVLATALKAGMTVFDLEHLELAYAPPYGSAKDPVNIAGFVAANWLRGDTDIVQWDEIAHLDPEKDGLLDVRTALECSLGHIDGAVEIPLDELRQRLGELSTDKRWIVYCKIGKRGYVAERILKQHGYRAANLAGGRDTYDVAVGKQSNFDEWQSAQAPQAVDLTQPVLVSEKIEGNGHGEAIELDACGLQCPGPIMAVYKKMQSLQPEQVLQVTATDPGFARDMPAWCTSTGNQLLDLKQEGTTLTALILKQDQPTPEVVVTSGSTPNSKTLVVFSGELDRALASFVIANGAAAMGQQVTMFFTFWGLNILRRPEAVPVKKNLIEKMFGWMLPRGADELKLSKLNMGGAGTVMMKAVMKAKHVDPLPQLIKSAQENGVRLIACQMSMDIMGIKPEELIDGVEIGGVATYISEADQATVNLFV
jgi:NADPH-dependent 2,4-dienoyl-CoA reductase/sulfur reductase-like enzyme/peroxiredoxin family protein/TusA-related sulfurtransferase/rhodanese-related sulfurtransferase